MEDFTLNSLKKARKERVSRYLSESNIPKQFFNFKWSDYIPEHIGDGIILPSDVIISRKNAKMECYEYSKNIQNAIDNGDSLIIVGDRGSGKSVLGTLILRDAIERKEKSVLYITFTQLLIDSRASGFKSYAEDLEQGYVEPDFLMIDEMEEGHEYFPKDREYITQILGLRARDLKPTIITSSTSMSSLGKFLGTSFLKIVTNKNIYKKEIFIKTKRRDRNEIYNLEGLYDTDKIISLLEENKKEKFKDPYLTKRCKQVNFNEIYSILNRSKI